MKYYVDRKFMPLQHAPVSINIALFFFAALRGEAKTKFYSGDNPLGAGSAASWETRHQSAGGIVTPMTAVYNTPYHPHMAQPCKIALRIAKRRGAARCTKLQIVGRLQSARSLSTFFGACQVYDVLDQLDQGQLCGQVDFRCRHDVVNDYAAFATVGCFFLARYQSKSGETSDLAYRCQTQQANERTEKISQSFFPKQTTGEQ